MSIIEPGAPWVRLVIYKITILLGLSMGMPALAEGVRFPLTPPEKKRLIVEHVYQFYVMRYHPPIEIKALKRGPFDPDTTAIAALRAQIEGDYELYSNLLSQDARKKIEDDLSRTGHTPTKLVQEWLKKFKNRQVILTHRIERGPCQVCPAAAKSAHSIIRYQVIDLQSKKVVDQGDLAITVESGRGWVVGDLTGDLIYENWDFPGTVKRIAKEK